MSRTLFVLRHGKSDWGAEYGGDHARPLKKRGTKAAQRVGRFLSEAGQAPELVLASSAVRARTTAEHAMDAGGWDAPLEVRDELYQAGPKEVLELVRRADPAAGRVLVVGHQPTCGELVAALTGGVEPAYPTATLARIDFEVGDWDEVAFGGGVLIWLIPPRSLPG